MKSHNVPKPQKRSYLRAVLGREYYTLRRQMQWLARSRTFAAKDPNVRPDNSIIKHRSFILRPLRDVEMYLQYNKITNLRLAIEPLNGIVIKSHGGTDEIGFKAALGLAYEMARSRLIDTLRRIGIEPFKAPANAVRRSTAIAA